MGDFFLLQMDDFFAEGVCFDNRKEGEGESAKPTLPHSAKVSLRYPCPIGHKGKAKGLSPVAWELRPYERSRCAEHMGDVAGVLRTAVPAPLEVGMVAPIVVPRNAKRAKSALQNLLVSRWYARRHE